MKKMMRARLIADNRGSALISVFMVITVIILMGMGILALSVANVKQAKADDTYERDYFAASGGAQQGVEVLKSAALEKYNDIADDLKNNILGTNNASSFFAVLDAVSYAAPQPDSSAGGPSSLSVTISHTTVDADTHRYSVLSTATDGTISRRVLGSIDINFVPVTAASAAFTPLGNETMITGGTLIQNSGNTTINGAVRFGALPTYRQWNFSLNGVANPDLSPYVDPSTASSLNWSMQYPGFTDDPKTVAALSIPLISNNSTVKSSSFPGGMVSPVYLQGKPGASFTVTGINSGFTSGQIDCYRKLTITSCTLDGSAGSYIKLYSTLGMAISSTVLDYCKLFVDGNLTISGGGGLSNLVIYCSGDVTIGSTTLNNVKIICGGNCTINGGGTTNLTIYSAHDVLVTSNDRTNMKVYCDTFTMSGGNIRGDTIVYAESSIHLESTVSGLFYTNGNIDIGSGSGLTGQIVAKGKITLNGSFGFNFDSAMLGRLNVNPFVTSSPGSGSGSTITQPSSSDIYGTPAFNEQ
jgi:hypothetical protein